MGDELYNKRRKQIGLLLQHERKCKKLEQGDIAEALGVRQEFVSKIESGTRRIDILELIDYCEALNFSLTDFSWKIESYLSALSLLPLPKTNIYGKRIRVEVSWCAKKFSASLGDVIPVNIVFMADSFVDLQKEVEEYIGSCMKEMVADGKEVPWWLINNEYELEYKFLDAAALLNAYSPYISLVTISRLSGINQNQLSQYANGLKNARPNQMKRILEAVCEIGKELSAAVI